VSCGLDWRRERVSAPLGNFLTVMPAEYPSAPRAPGERAHQAQQRE
jgi:hypothetical protein